ncbi:hypothetical protein PUH89_12380 [Rhodobacter capsulatus]|nr:hypothetical protein [Rhodobacter capsulatus]WER08119.1 hypothetical protein PUH89_12380 [Rhodobacter capsulatus]
MIFTSGTTGAPKAVEISRRGLPITPPPRSGTPDRPRRAGLAAQRLRLRCLGGDMAMALAAGPVWSFPRICRRSPARPSAASLPRPG